MCRSVPQMPVALTFTSTSPASTAGTGTSISSSPGPVGSSRGLSLAASHIPTLPQHDAEVRPTTRPGHSETLSYGHDPRSSGPFAFDWTCGSRTNTECGNHAVLMAKGNERADKLSVAERERRQPPCARWRALRPVARASEGAAEECRSEERNAPTQMPSRSMNVRFAKRDERLSSQRPCASATLIKMGEAPVKYELAGAS